MVNRINKNNDGERDKFTRQDAAAAIKYIAGPISPANSSKTKSPNFDDLIVSLAGAYENARARQVIEWEGMRRQNFQIPV